MSIWGPEDDATSLLLERLPIHGRWLDLACGDGRYLKTLLDRADDVVAVDIDPHVEAPLLRAHGVEKLSFRVMDATLPLPFPELSFDGILCTGTLHLFDQAKLSFIISEAMRILREGGIFVFDFFGRNTCQ